MLATGIKVIDLLEPYMKGGKIGLFGGAGVGKTVLINFVRDTAKVPVIETGAGVVHCYFDKDGDLEMGNRIITNAKCRRVSVCNALDCLLIHVLRF